jgi:hypothetical protein
MPILGEMTSKTDNDNEGLTKFIPEILRVIDGRKGIRRVDVLPRE